MVSSKEKLVIARDVLAAGPQPQPTLETVIITLMHIAFYSEKVELEVYIVPFIHLFIQSIFLCEAKDNEAKDNSKTNTAVYICISRDS